MGGGGRPLFESPSVGGSLMPHDRMFIGLLKGFLGGGGLQGGSSGKREEKVLPETPLTTLVTW